MVNPIANHPEKSSKKMGVLNKPSPNCRRCARCWWSKATLTLWWETQRELVLRLTEFGRNWRSLPVEYVGYT